MRKNLSAIKKARIASRNRFKNKIYKSSIKTLTKKYLLRLEEIDKANPARQLQDLATVYQKIDKAVKKGVLHKNNAARKKSLLAKAIKNSLNVD